MTDQADVDLHELEDYESDEEEIVDAEGKEKKKDDKYASIHAAGFKEFLLKPELLRAIGDCGFEHPSEVQNECIPQAIHGIDVLCQAKSGMGKTAVFVISLLQQLEPEAGAVQCVVLCHTRELAFQISSEFDRFKKYSPAVKTAVIYGGVPIQTHRDLLKNDCPNIIIGTPGRILGLLKENTLKLDKLQYFVLDECDQILESLGKNRLSIRLGWYLLPGRHEK